jgi:TRAP transporter TAXI family solute receptor
VPVLTVRSVAACALVAAVAFAACGSPSSGSGSSKRRLSIATGGTGGVFYPYGGGIAKVISEHLPNTEATAEVTAASVDNLKFLKQGTSDLAFTMADMAQDAVKGSDVFTDFGAVPVRTLAVLYSSYSHLVARADAGISSIADLRGRVVSTGAAGSGTTVIARRILQAGGLDPARDIREQSLGVAQSVDALKDGKIDAFFFNGGLPTASILDLVNTPGMSAKFIPTDAQLPRLEQLFGPALYFRDVIPRATYNNEAEIPVVAVTNLLVASVDMPEDLAHDITQVLIDRQAELAAIHPQAKTLSLKSAIAGSPVPFHPGAIRFYRERNVWTAQ